jgi:hypothetical protein
MNDRAFTSYHFSIVKVLPTARARFYLLQVLSSRFFDIKPPMFLQHRPSLSSTLSGPGPSTQKGLQFLPIFPVGRDRPVSQFRESYFSLFMRVCQGNSGVNFAGFRQQFFPSLSLNLSSKRINPCSENSLFGFYRSALAS